MLPATLWRLVSTHCCSVFCPDRYCAHDTGGSSVARKRRGAEAGCGKRVSAREPALRKSACDILDGVEWVGEMGAWGEGR